MVQQHIGNSFKPCLYNLLHANDFLALCQRLQLGSNWLSVLGDLDSITLYQALIPSCWAMLDRHWNMLRYCLLLTASLVLAVSRGNIATVDVIPATKENFSADS